MTTTTNTPLPAGALEADELDALSDPEGTI